jgi:hypothetical protein
MRQLSWQDITVQQFQDLYKLGFDKSLDDIGRLERIVCILFDKSEQEIDEMAYGEFNKLSAQCEPIIKKLNQIPGKRVKTISVNGRKYAINYSPSELSHRQYIEILQFSKDPVENMNLVMASLVNPVSANGKKLPNNAKEHSRISADMLQAKVVDVFHSFVFFCNLYINLIRGIQPYLVSQMKEKGIESPRAEAAVTASWSIMAGYIPQKRLRILRE